MTFAYTCVLISEITILSYSDHQTDLAIEFTQKFDAISMYIHTRCRNYHIRLVWSSNGYHCWIPNEIWCHLCTCSRNYHIRLVQSANRYHNWIPTEIWCHLRTRSRNYHIRLVWSPNRYHHIWNLLKKLHLVIPIISMCAKKPKPANSR